MSVSHAVRGDEQQVLVAHAADLGLPQPRLDRKHVAFHQRLAADLAEARFLVNLEPDAVAERELKALGRVVTGPGSLGAMAGRLEDLAGEGVQLAA